MTLKTTVKKPQGKAIDERMKGYEATSDLRLPRRMPMIIRVDGKCFHTLLRKAEKPFDPLMTFAMDAAAGRLCQEISGTRLAYTQSDEISLVVRDDDSLATEPWLDKRVQKMCSVAASIAAVTFTAMYNKQPAYFDARCFVLPESEVLNYLIWRQQDATRNAIQMVGQANFSQKQLHGKNCNQIQEMLFKEKGINFNDFPERNKRGALIVKANLPYMLDDETIAYRTAWDQIKKTPLFTQDRLFIGALIRKVEEDNG